MADETTTPASVEPTVALEATEPTTDLQQDFLNDHIEDAAREIPLEENPEPIVEADYS